MNEPLQRRAGGNVGVSPLGGLQSAYQQHVAGPTLLLENNETLLWEGVEGCVRSPGGSKPMFPGLLLTTDLTLGEIDVDLFFIDQQGNEFQIGEGFMDSADGAGQLFIDGIPGAGKLGTTPFGLCPGEKIVARIPSGATSPAGKVDIIPYTKDYKMKGAGKGGLSDGGALCLRGEVTVAGVDFGPPPGTTWEPLIGAGGIGGGGGLSVLISNADKVDPAELTICIVTPDGKEISLEDFQVGSIQVSPGQVVGVEEAAGDSDEFRMYIQYPSKLRVKYAEGETPNKGRVDALLLVGENDVPSDLAEATS